MLLSEISVSHLIHMPAPRQQLRSVRAICGVILLLTMSGCATDRFLSQSGPSRAELVSQAQIKVLPVGPQQQLPYALIPLDQSTVGVLGADDP